MLVFHQEPILTMEHVFSVQRLFISCVNGSNNLLLVVMPLNIVVVDFYEIIEYHSKQLFPWRSGNAIS